MSENLQEEKDGILNDLKSLYNARSVMEAAIMLLREVAVEDRDIAAELKRRGVSRTRQAIQEWARNGELEAHKFNPNDQKTRWLISKKSANARILAEIQRSHAQIG